MNKTGEGVKVVKRGDLIFSIVSEDPVCSNADKKGNVIVKLSAGLSKVPEMWLIWAGILWRNRGAN